MASYVGFFVFFLRLRRSAISSPGAIVKAAVANARASVARCCAATTNACFSLLNASAVINVSLRLFACAFDLLHRLSAIAPAATSNLSARRSNLLALVSSDSLISVSMANVFFAGSSKSYDALFAMSSLACRCSSSVTSLNSNTIGRSPSSGGASSSLLSYFSHSSRLRQFLLQGSMLPRSRTFLKKYVHLPRSCTPRLIADDNFPDCSPSTIISCNARCACENVRGPCMAYPTLFLKSFAILVHFNSFLKCAGHTHFLTHN